MGNAVALASWPDVDFGVNAADDLAATLDSFDFETASENELHGAAVAATHLCRRLDAIRAKALEQAAHLAGLAMSRSSVSIAIEGIDSAAAEVGLALALHRHEATTLVGDSVLVVQDLPLLWQRVREGRLAWKIATVTHERMLQCLQEGTDQWRKVEAILADKLPGKTWDTARRITLRVIHAVDPQATERRHLVEQKDCYVHAFPLPDGMGGLDVKMRADDIRMMTSVLDARADAERDRARRAGVPDERSHQQRRADSLLRLVLGVAPGALPTQQCRKPHLVVTVSLETLLHLNDDLGELHGHGLIPASLTREIARQAAKVTVVIDPEQRNSTFHGPGDQANCTETSPRYKPRQTVLDEVLGRFPQCAHPGCTRVSEQCDVDHAIPFAKGGRSCPCNLVPLCRTHHRLKTAGGWSLRLTRPDEPYPIGTIEFRSRLGQRRFEFPPQTLDLATNEADPETRRRDREAAWQQELKRLKPNTRAKPAARFAEQPPF
jgi:hypothetical protein